jgi:hypothetical protein
MVDPTAVPPPPPPVSEPPPSRPLLPWIIGGLGVAAIAVVAVIALSGGGDERPGTTPADDGITAATFGTSTTASETTTTLEPTTTVPATTTTFMPAAGGSWTVLVYMLGDNNLEAVLAGDLEEMVSLPSDEDLTIVAMVDRSADFTDREIVNLPNWETTKVVRIEPNSLTELSDEGELNLGDPAVLTDFVVEGIGRNPADHYAVILWNHGSPSGIGGDESHFDLLETPEIASALRAALDQTGVPRLDFIGFDACLMGALDVAVLMAPVAKYMIASEELEPGTGWDYRAFDYVAANQEGTVDQLGANIIEAFVAGAGPSDPTVTLSMIDLDAVDELTAALDELTAAMAPAVAEYAPAVGRERNGAISFGASPNPEEDFYAVDLGDWLLGLTVAAPGLTDQAQAVLAALEEAVVASRNGPAAQGATGLTVYFPPFPDRFWEGYRSFAAPAWINFLDTYYAAGAAIPQDEQPDFAAATGSNLADFSFDEFGLTLSGNFGIAAGDNAVEAVLYSGVTQSDGSIVYYGEDQGFLDGDFATATYDLTVMVLDDGVNQVLAYQVISVNEDVTVLTLDVPVDYYALGADVPEDAIISLVYDSTTDEFTETVYVYDETGTIGQLDPDPQGKMIPVVLVEYPDGSLAWEPTSDVGVRSNMPSLLYDWITLDPGTTMHAELWVCDYGGNCDWAIAEAPVPEGFTETPPATETCRNDWWGYEVQVPPGLIPWDGGGDPALECAYFDTVSMAGLDAQSAYDQAAATIEVFDDPTEAGPILGFLSESADVIEDATIAGFPATRLEAGVEYSFVSYVVEFADGTALVITDWGYDTGLDFGAAADWLATSMVFL